VKEHIINPIIETTFGGEKIEESRDLRTQEERFKDSLNQVSAFEIFNDVYLFRLMNEYEGHLDEESRMHPHLPFMETLVFVINNLP